MGAPATVSVTRASGRSGDAANAARARPSAVVSGMPAYMQVVDAGQNAGDSRGEIEALQQQEKTDDRDVAEDLADRIGQEDARETMQAEDARKAAQSDTAQRGRDGLQDVSRAEADPSTRAPSSRELVWQSNADSSFMTTGGEADFSADGQSSRDDRGESGDAVGADGRRQAAGADGSAMAPGGMSFAGGPAGAPQAGAATGRNADGRSDAAAGAAADGRSDGAGNQAAADAAGSGPVAEDVPRTADPDEPDTHAGDLGTDDLVLIDVELAEHQRWSAAADVVGAAGSMERAEFIAQTVGSGFVGGVASGGAMSLGIGLVTRAVPGLGPIIGAGMGVKGLIQRDWAATGDTIANIGKGRNVYDMLANTLKSVSTVIQVVDNILDTIGSIAAIVRNIAIGVAAGAGVLAFFTLGATAGVAVEAGELADVCHTINKGCAAVTTTLGAIDAIVLEPCIELFRSLDEFTSQADPREVEAGQAALAEPAAAMGGALGGWIGGKAAHIGAPTPPPKDGAGTRQKPPHETPPATGDGPEVHFQEPPAAPAAGAAVPALEAPPSPAPKRAPMQVADSEIAPAPADKPADVETPDATTTPPAGGPPTGADPEPAPQYGPVDERSFADLQPEVEGVANSPLGDRMAASTLAPIQRDPARSKLGVLARAYALIQLARPTRWNPFMGRQDQHWTKVRDATINVRPGELPAHTDVINANRSALQSRTRGEATLLLTNEGASAAATPGGQRGTRYYIGDRPMGGVGEFEGPLAPGQTAPAGAPADYKRYTTEHKFADNYVIPAERAQIQASRASAGLAPLDDVQLAVAAGEQARWRMEGVPSTDLRQNATNPWSGEVVNLGRADPPGGPATPPPTGSGGGASQPAAVAMPTPPSTPTTPSTPSSPTMQVAAQPATRGTEALGADRRQSLFDRAVAMGHDPDKIFFTDGPTEFDPETGALRIGPNVAPLPASQRPAGLVNPANAALDENAVLGHEVIGHAEAALGKANRPDPAHEEMQASIRAALFTPGLTDEQRTLLLQDAAARMRGMPGRDKLFVDIERYGQAAEAKRAAARATVSGDGGTGEPKVIIDPSLHEPEAAAPTAAGRPDSQPESEAPLSTPAPRATASPAAGPSGAGGSPQANALSQAVGRAAAATQPEPAHDAAYTDDNQPAAGVQRVNPNYSAPPGTPDQIAALQNEIVNLLAVRARAEVESQHEADRIQACEANRTPIAASIADAHGSLGAVRAHEQAIARRDAMNLQQQQRQQKSASLTGSYAEKATGLGILETPLAAWEGFTGLASHLPGGAGDKMAKLNSDARDMQDAFGKMDGHMGHADAEQPARAAALDNDSLRIANTAARAQASHQQLQAAADGAAGLQSANEATLGAAQQRQQAADQRRDELDAAAADRQASADTLAEQMRTWAQIHRDERAQAVAATVAQLQDKGKIVTESPTE